MRTPEEYMYEWMVENRQQVKDGHDLAKLLGECQTEAYNQAIWDVATELHDGIKAETYGKLLKMRRGCNSGGDKG